MKYFIASKWKNKEMVKMLSDGIKFKGHEAYSFLDNSANLLTGRPIAEDTLFFEEILKSKDWKLNPHVYQIFHSEIKNIRKCDALILLLPCGISSHLEAGIAYGLNKNLILIGKAEKPEIIYLIFDQTYFNLDDFLINLQ